jgi:hypothetical protein
MYKTSIKNFVFVLSFIFLLAGCLSGCGTAVKIPETTAQETKNVAAAVLEFVGQSIPPENGGRQAAQTPEEGPGAIDYQGSFRYIAEDGEGTDYPVWSAGKDVKTEYGEINVPPEWTQTGGSFTGPSGKTLLQMERQDFEADLRYFGVLPNHTDLIGWERLGDKDGFEVYAAALEADEPAASGDDTITIRKIVYFRSDKTFNYGGNAYFRGYALWFNKAFVNGGKIQYLISNQTIGEIVKSFKPAPFK